MVRVLRPAPEPPKASPVIANFPQAPELDSTNVELNFLAIFDYAKKLRDWSQLGLIEQREQAADIATNVTDIAGKAPLVHVHAGADITTGTLPDARIQASGVTQHEGSINHDNLTGIVAVEHLDWSADQGATDLHANNLPTHNHAATDLNSGTVATARLGSGTANSGTYLRGDQTYDAPPGNVASFEDLDDVSAFSGNAGEIVALNGAADTLVFSDVSASGGVITFTETTTPSTPGAGTRQIYAKSDGIYMQNSGGTEVALATDP